MEAKAKRATQKALNKTVGGVLLFELQLVAAAQVSPALAAASASATSSRATRAAVALPSASAGGLPGASAGGLPVASAEGSSSSAFSSSMRWPILE